MNTISVPHHPSQWPFLTQTNHERNLVIAISTFDHSEFHRLLPAVGANTPILGNRPLDYALRAKNYDAVFYLVQNGLHLRGGGTILHVAVKIQDVALVHLCLRQGYNPNAVDKRGYTPFTRSFIHLNPVIVSVLLKYGANVNEVDKMGKTVLHHLTENHLGYEPLLHAIFLYSPDFTIRDVQGETCTDIYKRMHYARLEALMGMFFFLQNNSRY